MVARLLIDPKCKSRIEEIRSHKWKPKEGENMYSKTWNSKLIISLGGIASITAMAVAGVLTGGVAVGAILGIVTGYAAYRQVTKK